MRKNDRNVIHKICKEDQESCTQVDNRKLFLDLFASVGQIDRNKMIRQ